MMIKLNDLIRHDSGVLSSGEMSEISDKNQSELSRILDDLEDFSSTNTESLSNSNDWRDEFHLSPLRANFLRAFEFVGTERVLEIGCGAGAITRYLAEQGLAVDAIESDSGLANLAARRNDSFTKVRIINENFSDLDLSSEHYDLILLIGVADVAGEIYSSCSSVQGSVIRLLRECQALLTASGSIFLCADNRQGSKYLFGATDERSVKRYYGFTGYEKADRIQAFNLTEWHELLLNAGVNRFDEYYLYPDFRFPRVLLNKQYINNNQFAYQHLEGLNSRDYYNLTQFDFKEELIALATMSNNIGGLFANSFLFVIQRDNSSEKKIVDFAHLPDFLRNPQYLNVVRKMSEKQTVERIPVLGDDQIATESVPFIPGLQLSKIWHRRLINDPKFLDFEQGLLDFYYYLGQLESGVYEGFNIDAIANNILVDEDGNFHLIDLEWGSYSENVNRDFVFYRAMVHFALRNASACKVIKKVKNIETLGDFLNYCFKLIGIYSEPALDVLEKYRIKDCEFLQYISRFSSGYQLSDPLGEVFHESEIYPDVIWRFTNEDYQPEQRVSVIANANNTIQKLLFQLPELDKAIEYFRFSPYEQHRQDSQGYFGIEMIELTACSEANRRTLFHLADSDQVANAIVNDDVRYSKSDGESVFVFSRTDTFLEFKMPDYDLSQDERLEIKIHYRVFRSHDYDLARHHFSSQNKAFEISKVTMQKQIEALENDLTETEKLKQSNVWRLLISYRDNFKITGYPEKSFLGKMNQFFRDFKTPR